MEILLQLLAVGLIPVSLSVVLYVVSKKTRFQLLPYWAQQLILGILFGLAAVCGTLFGVDVGDATANARDAAPLCAGLLFGGPAGIIAGVIGGVHRYIAAYYGAGMYSQVACSVSTILAGIYAAVLRKYMFEDKRVGWAMAALVAVVMEVVHMVLVFLTHLGDTEQAFTIVMTVTVPMVIANAFAVGTSAGLLEILATVFHGGVPRPRTLTERIQKWLLLAVLLSYLFTTFFVYALQTSSSVYNAQQLLEVNIQDVGKDIKNRVDNEVLNRTKLLASQYMLDGYDDSRLTDYAFRYGFQEINIVNADGIITASTEPSFVGFDMASGEQSAEFLILNKGVTGSYVQDYGAISYLEDGTERSRKYAATVLASGGFLQAGHDGDGMYENLRQTVVDVAENRRIGKTGYILITDVSGRVLSDHEDQKSTWLAETGLDLTGVEEGKRFNAYVYGENSICMYESAEGFMVIGVIPSTEVYDSRDKDVYVNSFMEVIAYAILFAVVYFLIKFLVVNDIQRINRSLGKIIGGDRNERINLQSTEEMTQLSGYINETVETLNRYIDDAKERIRKDLDLAKDIQHSALPSVFPPYPEIGEFDIYAMMDTAKEVGGDFYDFFLLGENRLAFLIADVSGKGIPAAMFMMRAKTLFKSLAESGRDAASMVAEVNDQLCQNNDAGMFVTAWFGILDYSSGKVIYVNAGHNPPLLGRKGADYEYLKTRACLVLAGMEGVPYRTQELELLPGDRLFLYTDGVTEATSINTELYGEDRLKKYLDAHKEDPISEIPGGIKQDIDTFINGADQFDDITMLLLEYRGAAPV